MKGAYPVIISRGVEFYVSYVPDFQINSQGKDLAEVIEMTRDAIGLVGIDMEDDSKTLPEPSDISTVFVSGSDLLTLVDVDFGEYRRKNELRTVKKNCTLPSWLCYEAEKADINFSQVLQNALKQALHIAD